MHGYRHRHAETFKQNAGTLRDQRREVEFEVGEGLARRHGVRAEDGRQKTEGGVES
jgi:hypothetical protein